MDEYISKDALQKKLNRKKAGPATKRYTEGWNDAILMVKSMIHGEKAADVAPVVHGRWISKNPHGYEWTFVCSNCGYVDGYPFNDRHNYCPNCGAKMYVDSKEGADNG